MIFGETLIFADLTLYRRRYHPNGNRHILIGFTTGRAWNSSARFARVIWPNAKTCPFSNVNAEDPDGRGALLPMAADYRATFA